MTSKMLKLNKIVDELYKYAEIDNTEWGYMVLSLLYLLKSRDLISTELNNVLEKELREVYTNVKENATIVKEQETVVQTYKRLEWNE